MVSMALLARCCVLMGCVVLNALPVRAGEPSSGAGAVQPFDLPGQPLKAALALYDTQTHLSVFFPSALVEGRSASAVQGQFAPIDALHRLLDGSGLVARAVAPDAFVLMPGPSLEEGGGVAAPDASAAITLGLAYRGRLQARVLQALCAREGLALGTYRLALRMHVDANGRASQVRLLDTTGDRARDAAIVAATAQIDIGQAPVDPSEPFVLLLRPHTANAKPVCGGLS